MTKEIIKINYFINYKVYIKRSYNPLEKGIKFQFINK